MNKEIGEGGPLQGMDGRADIFQQISVLGSRTNQSCDRHHAWAVKKPKLNIEILWSDLNSLKRLYMTNSDVSSLLAPNF